MIVDWVLMTDTCRHAMIEKAWGWIGRLVKVPLPYVQQPEMAWERATSELNEQGVVVRHLPPDPDPMVWHPDFYGGGVYRMYTNPYKHEDAAGVWPRVPLRIPNREFHVKARTPARCDRRGGK
jgi:hypothetical protein